MNNITIKYRRFFRERTIETTFPSCWSEMTPRQFLSLTSRPDDISLLSVMLNVSKRIVKRFSLLQIYELASLFDFIQKDQKVSSFTLESLHVPGIGTLHAPLPKLQEMTFMQFVYVDTFYMNYATNPRPETLYNLVSYLYSPKSGFDKLSADLNTDKIKKLNHETLEAISLNYGLIRKWITERYPLVFPKQKADRLEKKNENSSWLDVFDNVVGDDLKDRDKYATTPINAVFRFITKKIKESRK